MGVHGHGPGGCVVLIAWRLPAELPTTIETSQSRLIEEISPPSIHASHISTNSHTSPSHQPFTFSTRASPVPTPPLHLPLPTLSRVRARFGPLLARRAIDWQAGTSLRALGGLAQPQCRAGRWWSVVCPAWLARLVFAAFVVVVVLTRGRGSSLWAG